MIPATLFIKDNATIYQVENGKREIWKESIAPRPVAAVSRPAVDSYIKINHDKNELLTFEMLSGDVLVIDIYPEQNWNITSDTKDIAGHQCIKAITTYRGRDWEAWFAPDVALTYGPWKLHGLPGLILEAKSADGKFLIKAIKIEEISNEIFAVDFNSLRETRNSKPITYKQFLADQDEYFENIGKKMESEGMKVIIETPPRSGYELKYEWEK